MFGRAGAREGLDAAAPRFQRESLVDLHAPDPDPVACLKVCRRVGREVKREPRGDGLEEVEITAAVSPILVQDLQLPLDLNLFLDRGLNRERQAGAQVCGNGDPQYLCRIALNQPGE